MEIRMRRNDMVDQWNQLILYLSTTTPFPADLDRHLIRAAMAFTFFAFSIQKWNQYTVEILVPLISHSPWSSGCSQPSVSGVRATSSGRPKPFLAFSFSLAIGARGLASWARSGRSWPSSALRALFPSYPTPGP